MPDAVPRQGTRPRPRVLIGDELAWRSKILQEILAHTFRSEPLLATTYDELKAKAQDLQRELEGLEEPELYTVVALVASDLPYRRAYKRKLPATYLREFREEMLADHCFQVSSSTEEPLDAGGLRFPTIFVPLATVTPTDRNRIMERLSDAIPPVRPPSSVLLTAGDGALREQVCSLTVDRDIEAGKRLLGRLASDFFECDEVEVARLAQGGSGATVFRIKPGKSEEQLGECVLKLCPSRFLWKLKSEVEGHTEAEKKTGIADIRRHLPELRDCLYPERNAEGAQKKIAPYAYAGWHAICLRASNRMSRLGTCGR